MRDNSGDSTCGTGIVWRVGLQRTVVRGLAPLGYTPVWSLEDGASDYLGFLAWRWEPFVRVEQRGDVGLWLGHGYSLEALGSGELRHYPDGDF